VFGVDDNGEPNVDLKWNLSRWYPEESDHAEILPNTPFGADARPRVRNGVTSARGAVQAITTQDGWEDIGYDVLDGDFRRTGEPVSIHRPDEHSPHPLADYPEAKPFVTFDLFDRESAELDAVADAIVADVLEHGIDPTNVLVIPLGTPSAIRSTGAKLADRLTERSLEVNLVWEGNTSVFREDDAVTISGN